MPLVSNIELAESLENFVVRNRVIADLCQTTPGESSSRISRFILAALLGSNLAVALVEGVEELEGEQFFYLVGAYHCSVILERNISLIQHKLRCLESDGINRLQTIFLEMLQFFNDNYLEIGSNIGGLIAYYRELLQAFDDSDISDKWQCHIIRTTIRQCLESLSEETLEKYKPENVSIFLYEGNDEARIWDITKTDEFKASQPCLIKRGDHYFYFKESSTFFFYPRDAPIFKDLPFELATFKKIDQLPGEVRQYLDSKTKHEHRIQLKHIGPFPDSGMVSYANALLSIAGIKKTIVRNVSGLVPFRYLYNFQTLKFCLTQYQCHNILLKTSDHVIVDGLYAIHRTVENKHNTVALMEIARFPAEADPILRAMMAYGELFGPEMVFINHRNYANHSAVAAESIHEFGSDIAAFVKYFYKQGKRIILYGHCGSVSWIVTAKNQLDRMGIPVRIIADRTPVEISNFFDFKTRKRALEFHNYYTSGVDKNAGYALPLKTILYLALCYFTVNFLIKLCLMLANSDQNDRQILASLEPDEYLTLQGKSKKTAESLFPHSTDIRVHPDNDLRQGVKPVRIKSKAIIKSLHTRSCHLATLFHDEPSLKGSFYLLANCLTDYWGIIADEKLQGASKTKKLMDIHGCRLPDLGTRSGVPLAGYIHGYMAAPCLDMEKKLLSLYDLACSVSISKTDHPKIYYLVKLCQKIEKNHRLILSLASRAKSMDTSDLTPFITQMTKTLSDFQRTRDKLAGKKRWAGKSVLENGFFSGINQRDSYRKSKGDEASVHDQKAGYGYSGSF
ncbi:hypothetical protein [Legionella spiritensis]|uniref:hypothetical protein n=1 Tax=Legionella spiritensis TaxID=452 RepID=UPI000F6C3A1F|nr:hypothetical protein [Legionella spiritensis]VEG89957.1 Uncharacterised protein [Legionella spiritensis]